MVVLVLVVPVLAVLLGIQRVQPGAVFNPKMKNCAVGNSIVLGIHEGQHQVTQKVQPGAMFNPKMKNGAVGNSIVHGIQRVQPGAVFNPKMKNNAVGNSIVLGIDDDGCRS